MNGKNYKMVAPVQDIQDAKIAAKSSIKEGMIPVFEAAGIEVTRDNNSEMVLYCESLKATKDKFKFGANEATDIQMQHNSACVIKVENTSQEFGTEDLL